MTLTKKKTLSELQAGSPRNNQIVPGRLLLVWNSAGLKERGEKRQKKAQKKLNFNDVFGVSAFSRAFFFGIRPLFRFLSVMAENNF